MILLQSTEYGPKEDMKFTFIKNYERYTRNNPLLYKYRVKYMLPNLYIFCSLVYIIIFETCLRKHISRSSVGIDIVIKRDF